MVYRQLKSTFILAALLGAIILGAGCQPFSSNYVYHGTLLDPPLPLPNFELMDTNRESFQLEDVKGDIVLVFFGYTFCPDVCPLTLADVKKALADFEGRDQVKVLFISVDPERDTPEDVAEYLSSFDSEFIGLTDDYEKIQEVMRPFGAYAEKEEIDGSATSYLVSHTARLYLISPEQEILLTYPFGFEADDLRSDLAHLLEQQNQGS